MSAIEDLQRTMARLRSRDGGCPWDQEQTHASLVRCLIDEASELIDTIDRNDYPHMREELGDVLIQVVFHACNAEERGQFNFDDVAREINDKLMNADGTQNKENMPDLVHLSPKGYQIWADAIEQKVAELLGEQK